MLNYIELTHDNKYMCCNMLCVKWYLLLKNARWAISLYKLYSIYACWVIPNCNMFYVKWYCSICFWKMQDEHDDMTIRNDKISKLAVRRQIYVFWSRQNENFLNDKIIHSAITPCQRFQGRNIKGKFLPIQIQFI